MHCPECAHDNTASARFCNQCGTALPTACPHCAHENPASARFCNQCGEALKATPKARERAPGSYTPRHLSERILTSRSALQGERKRVTVLFADVKGSTEMAEAVGDEQWHQILDRFFAILSRGVHRYEGTINQYTGDGIMALFGAPIAHEDHALRACKAALDMQAEVRAYADELRISRGLNLSVRTGINSGEVVVGSIGDDLRMDYTAKGQTVNLAARMEQIAEPGRIYLTSYTASQVDGYVRLRDLGSMPVKGIRDPVHVFELNAVDLATTRLELSRARGLSRFVGRNQEITQLEQALQQTQQGQGRVVAVRGDGGIGKSRLCFELLERARTRDIAVYSATGVPYANAVPLYPVLGLLRSYFAIDERDSVAEQRRKIAGTLALLGHDCRETRQLLFEFLDVAEAGASPSAIPSEQRQSHLFEMMCQTLPQATGIILIEDLHWADAASLAFLKDFSAAIAGSRCLLLLNYRPDFSADWLQPRLHTEISLSALDERDIDALVDQLLGDHASLNPTRSRVRAQAAGNPFYVEEAIRSLAEQGYLRGTCGAYQQARDLSDMIIPDSVQGLIAARIDRLPEADKQVLAHAAVIGKSFQVARLTQLLEQPPSDVQNSLQQLQHSEYIRPADALGEFEFVHPLTQEVAYRSQLSEHRARIHARLAQVVESELDGRDHDERSLLLAHHWERAGDATKATQWQLQAALFEGVMRESRAALQRYRQAIRLAGDIAEQEQKLRLSVQARAGLLRTAAVFSVPEEECMQAYREAVGMLAKLDDPLLHAELLIAHGGLVLRQGDADAAVIQTSKAMGIARQLKDPHLIARFRIPILLAHFSAGRLAEGLQALNEPGQAAWHEGPINEDNFLSRAFRALMLNFMGQPELARRDLREAIAVEGAAGRTVSWMHANLVDVARISGRYDMAMREARHAVERVEQFGSPFFRAVAYRSLAVAHGLNGNWTESRRLLETYLPHVRRDGSAHQFEAVHLAHLAEALLHDHDPEAARDMAEQALQSALRSHSRVWECQARLTLARILRSQQLESLAEDQLTALDKQIQAIGAHSFTPFALRERAAISQDPDQRGALLAQARDGFKAMGADVAVLCPEQPQALVSQSSVQA